MSFNAISWMIGFGFAWACTSHSMAGIIIAVLFTLILVVLDVAGSGDDE